MNARTKCAVTSVMCVLFMAAAATPSRAQQTNPARDAQEFGTQAKRAPHEIPSPNWYADCKWQPIMMQMASRGHFSLTQARHIASFMANAAPNKCQSDWISRNVVFAGFAPLTYTRANDGDKNLRFDLTNVIIARLGNKLFFETEPEFSVSFSGHKEIEFGVEYANLQWFALNRVILEGGAFLTPFNVWTERIHPAWINEVATAPWVSALIPMTTVGGMLKGSFGLSGNGSSILWNGFIGTKSDVANVFHGTEDIYGGRLGFYAAPLGVEFGASYARRNYTSDDPTKVYGVYAQKKYLDLPLLPGSFNVGADVTTNEHGTALWLEPVWNLGKGLKLVASYQRFWLGETEMEEEMEMEGLMRPNMDGDEPEEEGEEGGHHSALPHENARDLFFGVRKSLGSRFSIKTGYSFGRIGMEKTGKLSIQGVLRW